MNKKKTVDTSKNNIYCIKVLKLYNIKILHKISEEFTFTTLSVISLCQAF